MKVKMGQGYRMRLENNTYLDISLYPGKWTTSINMSLWEDGNAIAKAFLDKKHINFNKFLPRKYAEKAAHYFLNKQSQKVAKFNLIK